MCCLFVNFANHRKEVYLTVIPCVREMKITSGSAGLQTDVAPILCFVLFYFAVHSFTPSSRLQQSSNSPTSASAWCRCACKGQRVCKTNGFIICLQQWFCINQNEESFCCFTLQHGLK